MEPDCLAKSGFFSLDSEAVDTSAQPQIGSKKFEISKDVIVDKKFRVISLLGKGGMGEVYLARHLLLDKDVALKIFGAGSASNEGVLRFQREAQSIAKLDHKNVVKVFDFGISEEGIPYYTMEYLKGRSLADRLTKCGALHPAEALELFIQICDGLSIAHAKGIVHRDLKPGNIFLENDASLQHSARVKIVDFGIATLMDQSISKQKLTTTDTIFGSPLYLSPEQATGQKITASSDIYSLGCTLFETLTGRPPFRGATARETIMMHLVEDPPKLTDTSVENTISSTLEKVVSKMLDKTPDGRQHSIEEVRNELTDVLDGLRKRSHSLNADLADSRSQKSSSRYQVFVTNIDTTSSKLLNRNINLLTIGVAAVLVLGVAYTVVKAINREPALKLESQKENKARKKATSDTRSSKGDTARKVFSGERELPFTKGVFKSKISRSNQKSYVTFEFPNDVEMGQIGIAVFLDTEIEKIQPIVANIAYPLSKPPSLVFYPSEAFVKDEDSFAILPTDALVSIKDCRVQKKYARRTIELIGRQHELAMLDMAKSPIVDSDLAGLQKLTKLESLRLDDTFATGSGVVKFVGCKRLRSLCMSGCKHVSPVLKKLENSKVIVSLSLDDVDLTEDDVRLISTMSNLEVLNLRGDRLTDRGLKYLAGLKHLKALDLRDCPVNTPTGVQVFKQLGKQRLQRLNLNYEGWSESDKFQLESYIPDVAFKTERTHRTNVPLDSQDLQILLKNSE